MNIAEVPLFADSRASRLIQMADLIAYGVFRLFEKGDDRFLPIIYPRFDREGQQVHGLVHWQNRVPVSAGAATATVMVRNSQIAAIVVTTDGVPPIDPQ